MTAKAYFIVEVDNFDGEQTRIAITDADGEPLRAVYCIAVRHEKTGVLQFVDYGYATVEEARAAWPDAQ